MSAAHKPAAPDGADLYLAELIFRPSDPDRDLRGGLEVDATDYPVYPAAPDLLDAAVQALACMRGLQQHLGSAVCQAEVDLLAAAIAKAGGAA